MDGLMLGLAIAAGVVVVTGGSLWVFFTVFLKRMRIAGDQRMRERFTDSQIVRKDLTANFFGLESLGAGQIRGNGVLVLARNELWFSRFMAREDLSIPLNTIRGVRLVDSHLGKRILNRQLIWVQFQTPAGLDAAAWAVPDPSDWKQAIESLLQAR